MRRRQDRLGKIDENAQSNQIQQAKQNNGAKRIKIRGPVAVQTASCPNQKQRFDRQTAPDDGFGTRLIVIQVKDGNRPNKRRENTKHEHFPDREHLLQIETGEKAGKQRAQNRKHNQLAIHAKPQAERHLRIGERLFDFLFHFLLDDFLNRRNARRRRGRGLVENEFSLLRRGGHEFLLDFLGQNMVVENPAIRIVVEIHADSKQDECLDKQEGEAGAQRQKLRQVLKQGVNGHVKQGQIGQVGEPVNDPGPFLTGRQQAESDQKDQDLRQREAQIHVGEAGVREKVEC